MLMYQKCANGVRRCTKGLNSIKKSKNQKINAPERYKSSTCIFQYISQNNSLQSIHSTSGENGDKGADNNNSENMLGAELWNETQDPTGKSLLSLENLKT